MPALLFILISIFGFISVIGWGVWMGILFKIGCINLYFAFFIWMILPRRTAFRHIKEDPDDDRYGPRYFKPKGFNANSTVYHRPNKP
jgi:hypothetical protein